MIRQVTTARRSTSLTAFVSKDTPVPPHTPLFLIVLVSAVGGFLFGYDLSIVSGAVLFLEKDFALTPVEVGFAVSSAVIGCILGPLLIMTGVLDSWGRKKLFMVTAIVFGVGAIGTAMPRTITEFNIYRIIGGVGVGVASMLSPMYISEIAPARVRGRMVVVNQLAIVIGSLASILVAYFLSYSGSWRWMFASECLPALLLLVGLCFVPESPRWLIEHGRLAEARSVLSRVDSAIGAEQAVREIGASIAAESGKFSELLRPGMRMALVVAVTLAILQQVTGISSMLFFVPVIFQKAGYAAPSDAIWQSVVLLSWNLCCTILALWLVERRGRRPLLLMGFVAMAAGLTLLGVMFERNVQGLPVLLSLFLCVGAFNLSIGPLAWLIMAEIFPTRIRAKAMAIATFALWTAAFLGAQTFPLLVAWSEQHLGSPAAVFWLYAAICLAAALFSLLMVPETQGRSLEEIAASWGQRPDVLESSPARIPAVEP